MATEKRKEYQRKWHEAHPDYNKQYYRENREKLLARQRARYRERWASDPDYRAAVLARQKKRYDNFSPEKKAEERERKRLWAAAHPEIIRRNFKAWRERQTLKTKNNVK